MASTLTQKLSSFFSYFLSRYGPAIVTLLILAGGFYFYFYVIVSENESTINDRNFRGLHRMASNVSVKINDYTERNTENFLKALRPDTGQHRLQKADASKLFTDYGLKFKSDTAKTYSSVFNVKFDDSWKFIFKGGADSLAFAEVKPFIEPLLRRDLFSHYMLLYEDTVLFDELNLSNRWRSDFLKNKAGTDTAIHSGDSHDISIGGNDYKLFLIAFIAKDNRKFTIGGYMPMEQYISEQRYVPTYAIIWLVIGVLLVALMFPMLKIFLMQRSEQLLARNAISSLAALHVGGAIVVLIAINMYVYFTMVISSADKTLSDLAKNIETTFLSELDAAMAELNKTEAAINNGLTLNDAIISPPQTIRYANFSGDSVTLGSGESYPYFKHIAWSDNQGM